MKRSTWLIGAMSLCLLGSCVKNPVTGEPELTVISRTQEVQIGTNAFQTAQQAQGGQFIVDPDLTRYVSGVGHRVARQSGRPDLPYEFVIVNDSTPNAWTLPGGKIAINRGLLCELHSEAELAAVLGHEIVHAAARHGAKGIERGLLLQGGIVALGAATQDKNYNDILLGSASVGAALISTKYGRSHELESDRYGMIYMAKAGYNPQAAVTLQELFLKLSKRKSSWVEGLFASHPPSEERIAANIKTAKELVGPDCTFDGTQE
jgi:predicted Zn-dependent protease